MLGIYGIGGEEKEEGHLQDKVLPLWGTRSLCNLVSQEEEQGRSKIEPRRKKW